MTTTSVSTRIGLSSAHDAGRVRRWRLRSSLLACCMAAMVAGCGTASTGGGEGDRPNAPPGSNQPSVPMTTVPVQEDTEAPTTAITTTTADPWGPGGWDYDDWSRKQEESEAQESG